MDTSTTLTRRAVVAQAWPVVLSQVAIATTGLVDTALMGRYGDKAALAAVGLASVTFSFVYWGFGFLRMATTGLTAQAYGAGDLQETRAGLLRALALGGSLGLGLVAVGAWVRWVALASFQATEQVESLAAAYIDARILGAPAALMGYAVTGWLLGMGRTRRLLAFQVVLNAVNAALDVLFTAALNWGPMGIGAGTAAAEWVALLAGLVLVRDGLRDARPLLDRARLRALLAANRDIMIRTIALLFAFAWFVNAGATVGTAALAGNEVLLQFVAVSAFVLDAFAFVAEREIGASFGARDLSRLRRAIRVTSELALASAIGFSMLFGVLGPPVIEWMVVDPEAQAVARAYLPYCAAAPLAGVVAWQLDGVFLGATQGQALRTAAVVATACYVGLDVVLRPRLGNTGVWIAFLLNYAFRACALGAFWPRLMRAAGSPLLGRGHEATREGDGHD